MTMRQLLTPLQRHILNHRLDVPDCISDVLADDGLIVEDQRDTVRRICILLLDGDLLTARAMDRRICDLILKDAVEGSTYYGAAITEVSEQQLARILRAGQKLAERIGGVIGQTLVYPDY